MCVLFSRYVIYSLRRWCRASRVTPSGGGVQMSETDFTCSSVCLSESVTYCQGSLLTQGWCCPQGYVSPCVWERSGDRSTVKCPGNQTHYILHVSAAVTVLQTAYLVLDLRLGLEVPEVFCYDIRLLWQNKQPSWSLGWETPLYFLFF